MQERGAEAGGSGNGDARQVSSRLEDFGRVADCPPSSETKAMNNVMNQ